MTLSFDVSSLVFCLRLALWFFGWVWFVWITDSFYVLWLILFLGLGFVVNWFSWLFTNCLRFAVLDLIDGCYVPLPVWIGIKLSLDCVVWVVFWGWLIGLFFYLIVGFGLVGFVGFSFTFCCYWLIQLFCLCCLVLCLWELCDLLVGVMRIFYFFGVVVDCIWVWVC